MHQLTQLTQRLNDYNMSNLIVSDPLSIRYLIGYHTHPGERLLVLLTNSNGDTHLFLNRLFPSFDSESIQVHYYEDGEDVLARIAALLEDGSTGIDKQWPSQFLLGLMMKKTDLQPVNGSHIIDDLRAIKSDEEIDLMRQASLANDRIMAQLVDALAEGLTENAYGDLLAKLYSESGHDGFSFDPIVAYGAHGADPHHGTSDSLPAEGDSVILDIGGLLNGYASDMTRTVFFGQPSQEALAVYEVVKAANLAGIQAVRPGARLSDVDKAARQVIEAAGYGDYFTHRLGHFIGQEAHEAGDVSKFNHDTAKVGQVFSIEPGIYLPGRLGVRIEDLVVVTEDGCEVLNHYPKDVIIVDRTNKA